MRRYRPVSVSPALGQTPAGVQQVPRTLVLTSGRTGATTGSRAATSAPAIPARAHRSPADAATAHLVILDSRLVPAAAQFHEWADQLAAHGYQRMRTGALAPRQSL